MAKILQDERSSQKQNTQATKKFCFSTAAALMNPKRMIARLRPVDPVDIKAIGSEFDFRCMQNHALSVTDSYNLPMLIQTVPVQQF